MRLSAVVLFLIINLKGFPQEYSPEVIWKFKIAKPIFGSPLVRGSSVYFGALDSCFYAVNLSNGGLVWKFNTKGEIRSTPATDGQFIYMVSGDGLYCLSEQGKLIWHFPVVDKQYDFFDYYQSGPVLSGSYVFFGSGDSFVYCIDKNSGSLKWKFKTGNVVHSTIHTDDNAVFTGSFDGYVYALEKHSGKLLWKFKTVGHKFFPKGEVMGSPAANEKLIFIGARDYNLYAIDKGKGFCHWNKSFVRGWALANTIVDSVLYTGTSDDRVLISFNPETGREYWRTNLGFNIFGLICINGGTGYIGTLMGKLHSVNLNTGNTEWQFCTDSYKKNRLKYFKEDDSFRDDIFSIIKSNEQFVLAQYDIGGIYSTPVEAGGKLFFTSTEGQLYCLKIK